MMDLQAVVETLDIERFDAFATGDAGMAALAYAARHPERISHLILWCSWASRASVSSSPQTKTLRALLDQDWTIYTETAARVLLGWSREAESRKFAEFYRECTSPEVLRLSVPAVYEWDVKGLLPAVKSPVLILQRRGFTLPTDVARELATGIADSRLVLVEGRSPVPFLEDTSAVVRTIAGFLGGSEAAISVASSSEGSVTILFTDMEGSTALTQRLGDDGAQKVVRAHNRIVREALAAHGGSEIKHTGDGLMVSFPSATRALECAVTIQKRVAEHVAKHPDVPLSVRVGLNAGEPVAEAGDYFGTAVQLAARICDMASPGEILVSAVVRDLAAGKGFAFDDRGETVPRGFNEAVRLYGVDW
jgi:class 3 adenylate cyclase